MQGNYFDVARRVLLEKDPDLFTVDFDKLAQRQKERREEMEKANPPRSEGPAEELRRLRRELYNITERAKSTETYANNLAGTVRLVEEQLNTALTHKKDAVSQGNLRLERFLEHSITRLEDEQKDAEKNFQRAQRVAAQCARELKEWPHHERLKELEKSLAG